MAQFGYCVVNDLREAGIQVTEGDDDLIRRLIQVASAKIDKFTSQWFAPVVGDQYIDGQNSPRAWLPNMVPIQKLSAIAITDDRSARLMPSVLPDRRTFSPIALSDVQVSRNKRFVEIIDSASGVLYPFTVPSGQQLWFPEGVQNVKLTGVFGWLEDSKDLEATVVGDVSARSGKIVVDDASGWEAGDWAVFPDNHIQIVTGVSGNNLLFQGDALKLLYAVLNDDVLHDYGKTPILIRQAAIRLAARELGEWKQIGGASTGTEDPTAGAIIFEETDDYAYRKDPSLVAQQVQAGGTGDAWVDSVLDQFIDEIPAYVGFA